MFYWCNRTWNQHFHTWKLIVGSISFSDGGWFETLSIYTSIPQEMIQFDMRTWKNQMVGEPKPPNCPTLWTVVRLGSTEWVKFFSGSEASVPVQVVDLPPFTDLVDAAWADAQDIETADGTDAKGWNKKFRSRISRIYFLDVAGSAGTKVSN